jgi:hypothetical protein
MAHGAKDQGDFLRMMRDMAGFLHHLGQEHGIAFGIQPMQGGEIER